MEGNEHKPHRFRKFLMFCAIVGVVYSVFRHLSQQPLPSTEPTLPLPKNKSQEADSADAVDVTDSETEVVVDLEEEELALREEELVEIKPKLEEPEEEIHYETQESAVDESELAEESVSEELETESEFAENTEENEDADTVQDDDADDVEAEITETIDEFPPEEEIEPADGAVFPNWVHPYAGECPISHPIKGRFATGRYHLPEDAGYKKVVADCCYETVEQAEADGFTHSRW